MVTLSDSDFMSICVCTLVDPITYNVNYTMQTFCLICTPILPALGNGGLHCMPNNDIMV